MYQKLCCYFKK